MNELAKVVHYYSLLEEQGSYKVVCPFHDDVNASLKINLEDNSFYCFGCNVSGDAFKFVKLMNKKLDDLQAYRLYLKILNSRRTVHLRHKLVIKPVDNKQATIEAMDYYNGLSMTNWRKEQSDVKEYLKKRGFNPYALSLAKAKINYNYAYPVIFPMYDNGEFKGWVCRTTDKEVEKKRKYLYNSGFSRRSTLVGDYKSKTVVIVEGYMDWLKMRQFGLKNVVAILGWKITSNQIEKLKNAGVEIVISALDNDTCGRNGTAYLRKCFNVVQFFYPEGVKDPGEMDENMFSYCKTKTMVEFRRIKNGTVR